MTKLSKAADFLENMKQDAPVTAQPIIEAKSRKEIPNNRVSTRAGLKHIGGYLDVDAVEKVAVLRARLGLDNSELIKLAIEDLHRKHMAKRAFGDA